MNDTIRITVNWRIHNADHQSVLSCISLVPTILLCHEGPEHDSREKRSWHYEDEVWTNTMRDVANKEYAAALDEARAYFQRLEDELESIILTSET